MGFPRQEYWSGLSFASPRDLSYSGIEPRFPACQADYLLLGHLESPYRQCDINRKTFIIRNQITEIGRVQIHSMVQQEGDPGEWMEQKLNAVHWRVHLPQ